MEKVIKHKRLFAVLICMILFLTTAWKSFGTIFAAVDVNDMRVSEIVNNNVDDNTQSDTLEGYCTFYDYVVAPYSVRNNGHNYKEHPENSINTASNYTNNGKSKLTVGTVDQNYRVNQHDCKIMGLNVNTCIYDNKGIATTIGTFNGESTTYTNSSPGIIVGLDKSNYKNVLFSVDEPGLFSDVAKKGKTILSGYKLTFDKKDNGDKSSTYTLKSVTSPQGDVTNAGDNFFPLNNADSNVLDKGYAAADGQKATNYYFGMRYDVSFSLNGYTGDLVYKFTGDDDLWVFLDGDLVLDLGGIHPKCGGDVDLWQVGSIADELNRVGSREAVDGDTNHTLTVLYMERGGNESNCNMQFTIPSTAKIETPDSGSINFKKTDENGNALPNAKFAISGSNEYAISDENGIVSFENLKLGTYTIREVQAPDGYLKNDEIYTLVISEDKENEGQNVAILTDSKRNVIAKTTTRTVYNDGKKSYATSNEFSGSVVNIKSTNEFESNKSAILTNWDNRTYRITITASSKEKLNENLYGVVIRDYIDNRFNILDDSENVITKEMVKQASDNGQSIVVNEGTVLFDSDLNLVYIEWTNQTVNYKNDDGNGWEKSFNIKANDNFIGGNNIYTNGEQSVIISGDKSVNLDMPTVNVKLLPELSDIYDVIFYGDNMQDYNSKQAEMFNLNCTIGEDGSPLSLDDFTINWSQDNNTSADEYKYYLRVLYNKLTNVGSEDSCTVNSLGNIADPVIYNKENNDDGSKRDYAVYQVNVVKGRLDITKCIDEQYTNNSKIRANETFVFKIEQFNADKLSDGTYKKGELCNTFYETISFDANGNVNEDTATITGLKKGFYTVTEQSNWTPEYTYIGCNDNYSDNDSQAEGVDIFIGKQLRMADYKNGIKAEFFGLDSERYQDIAEGEYADTTFENNKNSTWKWLSDVSSVINRFVK